MTARDLSLPEARGDGMAADFDLSGRVAIITGGTGGIGLGMARALARDKPIAYHGVGHARRLPGLDRATAPRLHRPRSRPCARHSS
jgi:NAD(P)-dependent dehydrogenase (short-subunit alcohol dehydrogenase family)